MTPRERYRQHIHFVPGAPCPNIDPGPRLETYERWRGEGLAPDLDPRRYDEWCDAFGLDRYPLSLSVDLPREPLANAEILEETSDTVTRRKEDGSIIQESKSLLKSIPHVVRPAVTSPREWDRLKAWLRPTEALPLNGQVREILDRARSAEQPVWLYAGSMMGQVRDWLGFEAFAMLGYDNPEWLEDMIEVRCLLAERAIRLFGENRAPLDGIHFWEDICFNNGPIMSPQHCRAWVVPRYRRVAELAARYGYDRISVDSDGNLWALLDLWMEGGVNVFLPVEVQAGMDIHELQSRYHGKAAWFGGIHKSRLTLGEKAIAEELERVRPAVERGGYIPAADHNHVPELSLQNYLVYLRLRHEILGLGAGAPDRQRLCLARKRSMICQRQEVP
jgi:hypothetical protein